MKRYVYGWSLWILLATGAYYLSIDVDLVSTNAGMACLKYSSCAGAIALFPILLLAMIHAPRIQRSWLRKCFFYSGFVLLLFYFFLTMDTYLFHAWTWYPGILRYALFDAYGILYLVFLVPGCLLYWGSREVRS